MDGNRVFLLLPGLAARPRHLAHALPGVLVTVFSLLPLAEKLQRSAGFPLVTVGLLALLVVQAFIYLRVSLRLLHRYRHMVLDQVSNLEGIDLSWLSWCTHLFLALYLAYAVLLALLIHSLRPLPVRGFLSIALSALVWVLG